MCQALQLFVVAYFFNCPSKMFYTCKVLPRQSATRLRSWYFATATKLNNSQTSQTMMKKTSRDIVFTSFVLLATFAMLSAGNSFGQQRGGGGRSQIMTALDTNGDRILSADEIAAASGALNKLDADGDGRLTRAEYGPGGSSRGGGGQSRGSGMGGRGGGQQAARGGQRGQRSEKERPRDKVRPRDTQFNEKLPIGSKLPDNLQLYNIDRELVAANSIFDAKYTVVVGGCLTCPEFRNSYPEIEAVAADYRDKGVQFYFLFQSLTHPENWGYVQPTSIQERFAQIDHAEDLLKTSIPWLADTMDNEMKLHFGMTPNSQFVFDQDGTILHRASWGRGSSMREWLTELVGPSQNITTVAELDMPSFGSQRTNPNSVLIERKSVDGVAVPLKVAAGGEEIEAEALKSRAYGESNRYAKLRPEADQQLINTGTGKLYLGFRQDPILGAKWNNLAAPPKYRITADGVTVTPTMAEAEKLDVESDTEPREFLVDVQNWEAGKPIKVEIQYFACNKEEGWCKPVTQDFTVWLEQDSTAGMVNGRSHFPGGGGRAGGQRGGGQRGDGQRGGGQRGGGRAGGNGNRPSRGGQ